MNVKKAKRIQRTLRKHKSRMHYHVGYARKLHLETPKSSSRCRCCGNPRKYEKGRDKLTIQERRKLDEGDFPDEG